MNQVSLIGRVVRPIVVKDCNGKAVVNNTLAVKNFKKDSKNNNADFIPFVAWGGVAEQLKHYVEKGQRIGIVGHIQTRSYLNKQEQQVYVVEVVAEYIEFLEQIRKDEAFLRQFEIDSQEES